MKIYIVIGNYDYEPSEVLGVFDSKELATTFKDSRNDFDFISIEEFHLNNIIIKNWKTIMIKRDLVLVIVKAALSVQKKTISLEL